MAARVNDGASRKAIRDMALRIHGLETKIKGLSRPRLVNAAIENTNLDSYDADGNLMAVIGRQYDDANGVITVNGPPPPKPGLAALTAVPTGVMVDYDGTWADGGTTHAPSDFSHFEVHASTNVGDVGIFYSTLKGQIGSARGGKVLIPASPDAPLYVWVVARTIPGKYTIGDPAGPIAGGLVTQDAIDIDWATLGGNTVFYGPAEPTTTLIGDLWFKSIPRGTGFTYEARRWDGDSWEPVADQGVAQAFLEAEAAQAAATLRARLYVQPTAPTGLGLADKGIWVDDDDGNRSYTWDGTAWISRRIGNGAIQPNSLIASDVIATGTVTAALLEAVIVLASTIVAGSPTGAHVEIDNRGVILFALGPDGTPSQSGALGTGDDGLTFTDPATGVTKTSVTRMGVSAESIDVSGVDDDLDGVADTGFRIYGQEFLDYFNPLPKGLVATGRWSPSDGLVASGISTPYGVAELSFTAKAGRAYKVTIQGLQYSSTSGRIRAVTTLRGTQDGTTPTVSNGTIFQGPFTDIPVTGEAVGAPTIVFTRSWSSTVDLEVRLLYVVARQNGDIAGSTIVARSYLTTDNHYSPLRWSVEDVGLNVADTLVTNDGGGDTNSGGTANPVSKKTYTTTWPLTWEASFDNSGKRSDVDLYQGTYGGNTHKGYCAFVDNASTGETTKTVVQALTNATVEKVELRLHCNSAYSYAGGNASIGYHGQVSEPGTPPAGAFGVFTRFFKRGETRWITLPSSTFADWKNGNYRGIVLGPSGDYMRFETQSYERPALRITYTR